jgi:allophanate hydrolase subunit 2
VSAAKLLVERAGPLTTIQDAGRPGWLRFGVPRSGPIDRLAFAAARAALGPNNGSAAIEFSSGGLVLRAVEGEVGISVAAPGFAADIDDVGCGGWAVRTLRTGERLRIRAINGNWGYVAFAAKVDSPVWLGSQATHQPSGLGGGSLASGDILKLSGCASVVERLLPTHEEGSITRVPIVLGPQDRFFRPDDIAEWLAAPQAATARFDRMGMVIAAPPLVPTRLDIPTAPIARGNVQADGAGQLTLLLADHQTTGGYPRVATLVGRAVDRVAQLPVGATFRLQLVSTEDAIGIMRRESIQTAAYLAMAAAIETLDERLRTSNLITATVPEEPMT